MSVEYSNIKIPEWFVHDNIDPFVNPKFGFSSRAHFVTEAIRNYVTKLQNSPQPTKTGGSN